MSETKIGLRASDVGPWTSDVRRASGTNVDWSRLRSEVRGLKSDREFRQLMFMRVADHLAHAGQSGDFFRRALRVAAGDHDRASGFLR